MEDENTISMDGKEKKGMGSLLDPATMKTIMDSALRQGSVMVHEQVNKESNLLILSFLQRKDVVAEIGEEKAVKLRKMVSVKGIKKVDK